MQVLIKTVYSDDPEDTVSQALCEISDDQDCGLHGSSYASMFMRLASLVDGNYEKAFKYFKHLVTYQFPVYYWYYFQEVQYIFCDGSTVTRRTYDDGTSFWNILGTRIRVLEEYNRF